MRVLTAEAHNRGLLVVAPDQAADHILACNVGVTVHQIVGAPDPTLSLAAREATIAAITGTIDPEPGAAAASATALLRTLATEHTDLAPEELALLRLWLQRFATARTDSSSPSD